MISGIKVDAEGKANKKDFSGLTDEKRQTFLQKRREFMKDSNVKFRKHANFEADSNGNGSNGSGNQNYAKMQRTLNGKINQLKQQLKDKDVSADSQSLDKKALIQSVNSADMPVEQRKKIVAYMEKHVKMVRTVEYNASLVKRANMLETSDTSAPTIVDGGADTGMNGSSYIFIEHTNRRANVIGYDADMVRKGLPIGTSVTATKDSNGETVILLQNEQIDHSTQPNSMLAPNQVRHYGIDLDDCPTCFEIDGRPGRLSMKTDDHEIPFEFEKGLVYLKTWRPSDHELRECPVIMITSDAEWNPESMDELDDPQTWDPMANSGNKTIVGNLEFIIIVEVDNVNKNLMGNRVSWVDDYLG